MARSGAAVMTHPVPYRGCWAERLVAPAHLVAGRPRNAGGLTGGLIVELAANRSAVVEAGPDGRGARECGRS